MSQRLNKDTEAKMSIIQEKINEYLTQIYSYEIEIEKQKLDIDMFNTEKEGVVNEKEHFKIKYDKVQNDFDISKYSPKSILTCIVKERLTMVTEEQEKSIEKLVEKDNKIITLVSMQTTHQQRIDAIASKLDEANKQLETLEKQNMVLEMNNQAYKEENNRLRVEQESTTHSVKKMNIERNDLTEKLQAANHKIASNMEKLSTNEEMAQLVNKELLKTRNNLVQAERYTDMLEIKKNAFERTTEVQKRQLNEQIKTLSEQATSEKDAREKWVSRYEVEYKSHLETTSEIMQLRTEVKDLSHKCENYKIELSLSINERIKFKELFDTKSEDHLESLAELEKTKRESEAVKGMLEILEKQYTDYVTRFRADNKKHLDKNCQFLLDSQDPMDSNIESKLIW